MSDKYNSKKTEEIDSKHQPGKNSVSYIKSSDYIPNTFKTSVNEKWLNSTFDQMISKGGLDDFDAWIGDDNQKLSDDVVDYLETGLIRKKASFSPAIVTTDDVGDITSAITYDDIIKNINLSFDDYNFNAAYKSQRMVYMPPVNVKKFNEYFLYYWTPDVPIYEANEHFDVNHVNGRLSYKLDDFFIENGMVIKNPLPSGDGKTYIVSGVSSRIKMIEYADSAGIQVYTDESNIVSVSPGLSFEDNPNVTHFNQLDKDYIVISRADNDNTEWSRSNHWISESTLKKVINLVESDDAERDKMYTHYLSKERQAQRPIIEFRPNIEKVATVKATFTQPPMFMLYDVDGNRLDDESVYPQNTFVSSKIFSYKEGSGPIDSETGLSLSYKDIGYSSDIIFENNIITERVTYTTLNENNRSTGEIYEISGLYYFKQDEELKTVYLPSEVPAGAQTRKQFIATGEEQSLDVNASDWDKVKRFTFRKLDNGITVDKTMKSGITVYSDNLYPGILLSWNSDYEFVNITDSEMQIGSIELMPGEKMIFSPNDAGLGNDDIHRFENINFIVVSDDNPIYHEVKINGNVLECVSENYSIVNDNIIIKSGIVAPDDIIDVEYTLSSVVSVDNINTNMPDVMAGNSTNELIEEITLSQSNAHWKSISSGLPQHIVESLGLQGDYSSLSPFKKTGTIYITDDTSLEHDVSYALPELDISAALVGQADDWKRFKTRFMHQSVRQYASCVKNGVSDITAFDIMQSVLNSYVLTRQGTTLYVDSGMLVSHPDYIPQSLTRIGLSKLIQPFIDYDRCVLVCHDGSELLFEENDNLIDVNDANYNPSIAVLFELETAIFNTLSNDTSSVVSFMPTISNDSWYDTDMIDSFVEKYFKLSVDSPEYGVGVNYSILTQFTSESNYAVYDELDYLPGTWQGAYITLFGTHMPHREPWMMLGFSSQPSWWEDRYPTYSSWNDSAKVEELKFSLKTGIVNDEPHARKAKYSWDWENRFPVDTNGELVDVNQVLDPNGHAYIDEYVYGDWAGDELVWRLSANGQAAMLDAIVKLNPTIAWNEFKSGIKIAQQNYITRQNYDIDLDDVFNNVETRLAQKIGGFTSKHLLNITAESSRTGKFIVESEDYQLGMYRSAPSELITASVIIVSKTEAGNWKVDGISANKQQFEFYPIATSGTNDYRNITIANSGATIRRYTKFAKIPNTVEFGAIFSKVQDVFNFIIGYREYLEEHGYFAKQDKDVVALEFAQWALKAASGEKHIVSLGDAVLFSPEFGHIEELNTLPMARNSVFDIHNSVVTSDRFVINRTENSTIISMASDEEIGSVTFSVVDYEHVAIFNNRTTFNKPIFDKKTANRQERLRIKGQRTEDWSGNKRAPGFLVFEDKIVENFDTSVSVVSDFYSYNSVKFNECAEKTENITIGNIQRDWSTSLQLDNNTIGKFYQGTIRDKGTKGIVDKLDRSTLINTGITEVSIDEEWMLRQSFFGDITGRNSAEYEIRSTELTGKQQGIYFTNSSTGGNNEKNTLVFSTSDVLDGHLRVVNYAEVDFDPGSSESSIPIDYTPENLKMPIAGELTVDEATHSVFGMYDVPSVYDDSADYANIDTWVSSLPYARGDKVRHKGRLWKCAADYIQLNVVTDGIEITGTSRNPTFPDGSTASIDGIEVTFGKDSISYENIVRSSSEAVVEFDSFDGANIVLDNVVIPLETLDTQELIKSYASVVGTVLNPTLTDREGENIIIKVFDGETTTVRTIDFTDTENVDIYETNVAESSYEDLVTSESITGIAAQQVYSISGAFDSIDSVTVDGIPYTETTDWTIVGQDITFTSPTFVGGENIVITTRLVDGTEIKQSEFTVIHSLGTFGGISYSIDSVKVNDVTVAYSLLDQLITLDTPAEHNDEVVIHINVVSSAVLSDIVNIINAQVSDITGLVAEDDNGRVRITYNIPDNTKIDSSITIDYSGTANDDIGFSTTNDNETVSNASAYTYYGHDKINVDAAVNAINNSVTLQNIYAYNDSEKLTIVKTNTSAINDTLLISGTTLSQLNIQAGEWPATTSISRSSNTAIEAVELLNAAIEAAGTSNAVFSLIDGSIRVSTVDDMLDMGDENNEFNTLAGLPYGTQENINSAISNPAPSVSNSDWEDISSSDPALFSIWVTDDSALGYETINNVQVQHDGWNLFQVMNMNWYTYDSEIVDNEASEICSICAGTATSDGNDAQITLSSSHNLQVGDIIMLLNTTTTPNIDGIHTVTKISPTNDSVFYIDRYIEKCGKAEQVMLIRPVRFNTFADRNESVNSEYYNLVPETLTFVNFDQYANRSSNVYLFNGGTTGDNSDFDFVRKTDRRPNASALRHVRIYDADNSQTSIELEIFDPIRGIIPGIADREITFRGPIDFAVYTNSTSNNIVNNESSAWGESQVGQTWWDTSTARYYDYDQSNMDYSVVNWGKQFPGSSIDVYEWTKSSVSPDRWKEAVAAGTQMFGIVASGEAYYVYDLEYAENNYFYVEHDEWNRSLGKYDTVYYFWVKNKITNDNPRRNLTVNQISEIISNPTEAGINWCAVVNDSGIVVSNIRPFVKASGSVIQINTTPKYAEHNNWIAIREDKDLIPEFWYNNARSNLVGYDTVEENEEIKFVRRVPDILLNKYNRYGNERKVLPNGNTVAQGWYEDVWFARREALDVANTLLSDMNVFHELPGTWWRNITRQVVREAWDWTTYVHASRNSARMPSMRIDSHAQLFDTNNTNFVDVSKHQVVSYSVPVATREETFTGYGQIYTLSSFADEAISVKVDNVEMIENKDWIWIDNSTIEFLNEASIPASPQHGTVEVPARGIEITGGENIVVEVKVLDRSEIFEYIDNEWILVEKKNSTIKFNKLVWKSAMNNAWDMQGWDTNVWDNNYGEATHYIIKAFREDLFIQDFIENFNKWFLAVAQYSISQHEQVDWLYKTTYISANVETPINTTKRKYSRNNVDSIIGYINDVKPFHAKIRTTYDINTIQENVEVSIDEYGVDGITRPTLHVTAKFEELYLPEFVEDTISSTFAEIEDSYSGGSFVSEPTDAVNGATFLDNILINSDTLSQPYNNTLAEVMPSESFAMVVQTDGSVDSERRTMVYLQDKNNVCVVFGLEDDKSTTIATAVSPQDSIISIADASAFNTTGGFAYYNGSVIRYAQVIGNDLIGVTYGVLGTYAKSAEVGDMIVDVTNSELTFTESDILQFNDIDEVSGKYEKLLESNTNILPQELQALGQGVNF